MGLTVNYIDISRQRKTEWFYEVNPLVHKGSPYDE